MRLAAALAVPFLFAACREEVPVPVVPPRLPPAPAEAAVPPPAPGAPAAAPTVDLKALDRYVGFSQDGLAFAFTEFSSGAGLPVLTVLSSTTGTVEKSVPLDSDDTRRRIAAELADDGFPAPGMREPLPSELSASLVEGLVVVRFGPVPAARPLKPFADAPAFVASAVEIAAVSKDGKRVALRITGKGGGEFGPPVEHRIVELFK